VAEQLVDPVRAFNCPSYRFSITNALQCFQTRVAREHYHYSNEVKEALPPAIDAVDEVIHGFASNAGV
jgi:hypothetical protein